ncbi:hypothetical protein GBL97_15535 [Yersinia pseudotuberculosis]|nr:hypothetical protein [Yersinia pseudotuberculosis]MBO1603923.1 hypothetical protein [Yersinia pseudotuberculosis]
MKITSGGLAFLAPNGIDYLQDACADSQSLSLLLIAKICLATNPYARWSEAEKSQGNQISKY